MNNKREQRCMVLRELLKPYCEAIKRWKKSDGGCMMAEV